ncbi:hypothetical protein DFS33DRAFT_1075153 [Desarmillaria ectypa]|nr:hypothetical protein DFS33DRAFT_1075153 [Desarmillaria ectypa]
MCPLLGLLSSLPRRSLLDVHHALCTSFVSRVPSTCPVLPATRDFLIQLAQSRLIGLNTHCYPSHFYLFTIPGHMSPLQNIGTAIGPCIAPSSGKNIISKNPRFVVSCIMRATLKWHHKIPRIQEQ